VNIQKMNIMFSVCCDDIHFYSDGDTEVYIVVREEGNPSTAKPVCG
jgi:hypothetical protein